MKKLPANLMELKEKLDGFNLDLSDDEANDLLKQFSKDEKAIFERVINQIDQENITFKDIFDKVDEDSLKGLISLLLSNPKFLNKTHELFLNKSIE